jgi:hypothetical protein
LTSERSTEGHRELDGSKKKEALAAEEKEGGELGRLGFAGLGDFKEGRKLP